ncbi:MAG: glucose-6-phosphate isomerase, partial [Pseudomonadota bacterium]|nr:glucose-6-phosphate isomerase [Pseudomonadota bacterium]
MLYAQNINDCLASEIGDGGLEQAAFERYLNKVSVFLPSIRAGVANGEIPFLNLPKRNFDLPEIRETAARFRADYDDIIVLGTGGSSLGGRTLCALAPLAYPNLREGPRIHFADNVDPHSFDLLIADTDWTRTGVIAISKSGATAETLAQFAILWRVLLEHMHENQASDRVAVITEPGGSPLASMAVKLGC